MGGRASMVSRRPPAVTTVSSWPSDVTSRAAMRPSPSMPGASTASPCSSSTAPSRQSSTASCAPLPAASVPAAALQQRPTTGRCRQRAEKSSVRAPAPGCRLPLSDSATTWPLEKPATSRRGCAQQKASTSP